MPLPQEDVQEFSVAVQIKTIALDLRWLDILNLQFLKCQFCQFEPFGSFLLQPIQPIFTQIGLCYLVDNSQMAPRFFPYFYLIKILQTTNALTFLKHIILVIVSVSWTVSVTRTYNTLQYIFVTALQEIKCNVLYCMSTPLLNYKLYILWTQKVSRIIFLKSQLIYITSRCIFLS